MMKSLYRLGYTTFDGADHYVSSRVYNFPPPFHAGKGKPASI